MTAIDISDRFIANSPTTIAVTPAKSGLHIRGSQSVITTLGTPLTLTKQANRNMRWRQTTRDVAALIAGGQMAYTTDTPTYTSISNSGSVANNNSSTLVITGTRFEGDAKVYLVPAVGSSIEATVTSRTSTTGITFKVPLAVPTGTYSLHITDTQYPTLTVANAVTVTGLALTNSTESVNNNNIATCTLTGTDIRSNLQVIITDVSEIETYADNVTVIGPTSATFTVPVSVAPGVGTITISNDGSLPAVTRAITIT